MSQESSGRAALAIASVGPAATACSVLGASVLGHTLRAFERCEAIDEVILACTRIVLPVRRRGGARDQGQRIRCRGVTRQDSVIAGLTALSVDVDTWSCRWCSAARHARDHRRAGDEHLASVVSTVSSSVIGGTTRSNAWMRWRHSFDGGSLVALGRQTRRLFRRHGFGRRMEQPRKRDSSELTMRHSSSDTAVGWSCSWGRATI